MRSTTVNLASMRALSELKKQGNIILVFPSGTRYRPWDPSTKKGVREIDSYIKSFSKMASSRSTATSCASTPRTAGMEDDLICEDRVVYTAGPSSTAPFREQVKHVHRFHEDKKQAMVDEIMAQLERLHEAAEKDRLSGDQ